MSVRLLWMIGAGCVLALIPLISSVTAEDNQLLATVDNPAILTATPANGLESTGADQVAQRVIVHITGYQPPQNGSIRGVVKVQKADGSEQEIGTFGVFPDAPFKADSPRARRYSFPLPKDLAAGPLKLKVEVVPDKPRATGEGARLEVGGAEIQ